MPLVNGLLPKSGLLSPEDAATRPYKGHKSLKAPELKIKSIFGRPCRQLIKYPVVFPKFKKLTRRQVKHLIQFPQIW